MTDELPLPARVGLGLREYGTAYGALGRVFAERLRLHTSDANALVAVIEAEERAQPISANRLATRIGLTAAATSALLNRLEGAGHLVRVRTDADRRIVTLRSTAAVHRRVDEFFDPLEARLDALMAGYPPAFLEQLDGFLHQVVEALDEHGRPAT
jgi:DNA-binding MarR family transcriptional regulator